MPERKIDLLPPKSDFVFCRLFGAEDHKRVLICLLNAILDGKPHVKSVTLNPTEHRKRRKKGKSSRLDIVATTDDKTIVNIEMQCKNEGDIADRASFYRSQERKDVLDEGENYSTIPNVITIWICNENMTDRSTCVNEIVDMFKDNGVDGIQIASEKMRTVLVEMPKLEKTPKHFINEMLEIWIKFIRDPKTIPSEFLKVEEVSEAMKELEVMSMDKATRSEYYARLKELNDRRAEASVNYDKGVEDERERAHQEKVGRAEEMIKDNLPDELVSRYSGLSIDEVSSLR